MRTPHRSRKRIGRRSDGPRLSARIPGATTHPPTSDASFNGHLCGRVIFQELHLPRPRGSVVSATAPCRIETFDPGTCVDSTQVSDMLDRVGGAPGQDRPWPSAEPEWNRSEVTSRTKSFRCSLAAVSLRVTSWQHHERKSLRRSRNAIAFCAAIAIRLKCAANAGVIRVPREGVRVHRES